MSSGTDITREALDALAESLYDFQDFEEAFGAIEW